MNERIDNTTIAKLEHAYLPVGDVDRSLAFYRLLFPEWAVRWTGENSHGGRWAHFGVEPTLVDPQPGYLSLSERKDALGIGEAHIGFSHPDVRGLLERVAAEGVQPHSHADDGLFRRAYINDPDGNELEIVQAL